MKKKKRKKKMNADVKTFINNVCNIKIHFYLDVRIIVFIK